MRNLSSCAHVPHKTLDLVISRCCFAEKVKENAKIHNAGAERLFCDVFINVTVIDL